MLELQEFVLTATRLATPIAFAALGGVVAEKAGVYNVALEGSMLAGCFGAALGAFHGGPVVGLACGMAAGLLVGALLGFLTISLKLQQIVSGIAINLLLLGLTAYLSRIAFGGQANTLQLKGLADPVLPSLVDVPVLGPLVFAQSPLLLSLPVLTLALWWVVSRTHLGLALRAAGDAPRSADANGIDVVRVRWMAVLTSCALAAMGGSFIVLCQVFLFSEHMTAGKGFIALAVVILSRWSLPGALAASLLFGMFDALQLKLQFSHPEVPYQLFIALPYVAALLALLGLLGRYAPPQALGKPYTRTTR